MPAIKSIQLMVRVLYADGVSAMIQHPDTDLQTGPAVTELDTPGFAAVLQEQFDTILDHAREQGPEGIYQEAAQEAAARREQFDAQAEEAKRRMALGQRMRTGPRMLAVESTQQPPQTPPAPEQ